MSLHDLIATGAIDEALDLIKGGCNIDESDYRGFTPLHTACLSGFVSIVRALLDAGVENINALSHFNETPLYLACTHGFPEIVSMLISENADLNIVGMFDFSSRLVMKMWNIHGVGT